MVFFYQFGILVVIIGIVLFLLFYKVFIKIGRLFNNHIKNIKKEIGRDEE
ncbi:hypothetical protein ACFVR2_17375 [Gottfriedia sp. NPDC057991]|jgi:Sec-independent protein translocase protein TatA|uniref:ATP synthase F0 subunit 8 n=1 Tax=Gottfriedia acidiceleris TaxID=371036 RepID=A0ABY4JMV2_9BACI|nr:MULTISPECIES: hypothetical protein [Bacillaceae]UPM53645.1 hypothetical protein MY490_17930 [Gottfriedia acidiceleris]